MSRGAGRPERADFGARRLTQTRARYKNPHLSPISETEQTMPNIASAKKRVRRTERQTAVNRARRSRIRSSIKQVETAIAAGDKSAAAAALKTAEPEIMRGVTKGVIEKNTASRKVSRLSARIKALG